MTTGANSDAVEPTSLLYEQILEDFFDRVGRDNRIPIEVRKRLEAAFALGNPKSAALIAAFNADDDLGL